MRTMKKIQSVNDITSAYSALESTKCDVKAPTYVFATITKENYELLVKKYTNDSISKEKNWCNKVVLVGINMKTKEKYDNVYILTKDPSENMDKIYNRRLIINVDVVNDKIVFNSLYFIALFIRREIIESLVENITIDNSLLI